MLFDLPSWLEAMSVKCRLLFGVLVLTPVLVLAQSIKLAPELGQITGNQMVSVIVEYKPPMSLELLRIMTNSSSAAAKVGIINAVRVVIDLQTPWGQAAYWNRMPGVTPSFTWDPSTVLRPAEFVTGTPGGGGLTVWGSSAKWGNSAMWGNDVVINGEN